MNDKIEIKVLILPKIEIGEMTGDAPGEAQFFYEEYFASDDTEKFRIQGTDGKCPLYVNDGTAMILTGTGKVSVANTLTAVLLDTRFDFSQAYILCTGCAGSVTEKTVIGDVVIETACVDFDLGHHADPRDMKTANPDRTWFREAIYDDMGCIILDQELCDKVYRLAENVKLSTTARTKAALAATFDDAEWTKRDPKVSKGTSVAGDNYWKGKYDEANAIYMAKAYECPDPYMVTEMEDVAAARVARNFGMLDRFISMRVSVDMDVFLNGESPETIWGHLEDLSTTEELDERDEMLDMFPVAMKNAFIVGKAVIDGIRAGL